MDITYQNDCRNTRQLHKNQQLTTAKGTNNSELKQPQLKPKETLFHNRTEKRERERERDLCCLEICGGEWFMGVWADEEELVDDGGDGGTNEWTDPVDPVVGP
jgi:hypothetical protein